ncbi:MAG: competence/damage-inducible protein A [Leptolyngbya sp.]|nr:competence/damage-inducible protein A [Candidatus Melainabacteria bacterium]
MPNAEIVSIGTELLLGDVLDTNSKFFASELARIGIDCFYRSTVGDNKDRIKSTLKVAFDRSDIVITSGGLGPTADDLTTECIAEMFGVPLQLDETILAEIEAMFAERKLTMPETNKKQAMRPKGADILPNENGTAPGIIWLVSSDILAANDISEPTRKRVVMTFPGVPSELIAMWTETARDYIIKNFLTGAIYSVELKHYGIGESALAEKYGHLLYGLSPSVAPYAGQGECRLRVAAKASTMEEARELVMPVVEQIRRDSGTLCYGQDDDNLETVVGRLLVTKGMTLSVAESCTGGLVSKRLTDVSGSSKYTKVNVVTYANEVKQSVLKVSKETLDKYGAVSAECAEEMAVGVRAFGQANIGLSITGIAGPDGGTAEKPIGTIFVGLAHERGCTVKKLELGSRVGRHDIRLRTSSAALNMVRLFLLSE